MARSGWMTEMVSVICERCGELRDGAGGDERQWGERACRAAQTHADKCGSMVSVERGQTNVIDPASRAEGE